MIKLSNKILSLMVVPSIFILSFLLVGYHLVHY